jgi:hypothetical protein
MKHSILIVVAVSLAACAAAPREPEIPAHGVIGVTEARLDPDYWIRRGAAAHAASETATTMRIECFMVPMSTVPAP